jgi:hypothetical protein
VTSNPRPFADTLPDQGFLYQPNPIKGNKPTAIGNPYSFAAVLPERDKVKIGPWVIQLARQQVVSQANTELVGDPQIKVILDDEQLPFGEALCAKAVDSAYSKPVYLIDNRDQENFVTIARARGPRNF